MEEGAHVWLRSPQSDWGWLPARITKKEILSCQTKKHRTVDTDLPKSPTGSDKPKSAEVKAIEEEKRKALQSIIRNRSLQKNERKQQMDQVKAKFDKLIADQVEAEAEAEKADEIDDASPDEPSKEETEETQLDENSIIQLTLIDDYTDLVSNQSQTKDVKSTIAKTSGYGRGVSGIYAKAEKFQQVILIDHARAREEHPDIKLRNMPTSDSKAGIQFYGAQGNHMLSSSSTATTMGSDGEHMPNPAVGIPATHINDDITGGVDDLIGLTHLHEPAVLHALRLRYDVDAIYTNTGPILLAINPFKVSLCSGFEYDTCCVNVAHFICLIFHTCDLLSGNGRNI